MSENEVVVKLTALGESFQSGLNDAIGQWTNFLGKLSSGPVTFAAAATAGAAVGGALFGLAKMAADTGEKLLKLHQQTGMSVESLSLLKYAAEQSETSIDAVAQGSKFLNKNLLEAAAGSEGAKAAFAALGLSVNELLQLPMEERFLAMADALKDVEDPGLRSTLAIATMGKAAAELLPLMILGAEGIRKLKDEGKAMGTEWSEQTAKQADEFNDSLHRMWTLIKQIGLDIGALLMPPLRWLFEILTWIVNKVKGGVLLAFDGLRIIFDALVGASLIFVRVLAEVTDALGLTSKASEKVSEWQDAVAEAFEESKQKGKSTFNELIGAIDDTNEAQKDVNKTVKHNTDLTTEQRLAILKKKEADKEAADAAKKHADEQKKAHDGYIKDLDQVLEYKKTVKQFDDEYFAAYRDKLITQGINETQAAQMVTAEKKRLKADELQTVVTITSLEETAVKAVADSIKLIWSDTTLSARDAWHNALNSFVDVMAKMIIQAIIASKTIQVEMAAATAGVTLLIGLIASVFMHKRGKSALQQATEEFLRSVKETLRQFEAEVLGTLQRLTNQSTEISQAWREIQNSFTRAFTGATVGGHSRTFAQDIVNIVRNLGTMKDLILDRYQLEKALINDITDLLKNQRDFVRGIDEAIQQVTRSTYSDTELFEAQKQDIRNLLSLIGASTGEDKFRYVQSLQQTYMSFWDLAQKLFSGEELAAIQTDVLSGLADLREEGVSAYDQLIDINLEMLGVQRHGADLQQQMVDLLDDLGTAVLNSLNIMSAIGSLNTSSSTYQADLRNYLNQLADQLTTLGLTVPHLAGGGIITAPTLALIGERGREAVIPLDRPGAGLGMSIGTLSVVLPNVKDMRNMTENDWIQALKKARYAAQRLGRDGYDWGMA